METPRVLQFSGVVDGFGNWTGHAGFFVRTGDMKKVLGVDWAHGAVGVGGEGGFEVWKVWREPTLGRYLSH